MAGICCDIPFVSVTLWATKQLITDFYQLEEEEEEAEEEEEEELRW